MRCLTIIILFLSFSSLSNAQKIRYTDKHNQWISFGNKYWGAASCGYTRYRSYTTDTVINSKTYTAMTDLFVNDSSGPGCHNFTISNTFYYVREDTIAGFVYYWSPGLDTTTDHVLYNYNLHINETFTFNGDVSIYGAVPPFGAAPDSVMAIDSILIDGVYHKKWVLGCTQDPYTGGLMYTVVEGIGSLTAPYAPFHLDCMDNSEYLGCFTQSGIAPTVSTGISSCYTAGIVTFTNSTANCHSLSVKEAPAFESNVSFFPNPANDLLSIRKTDDHEECIVSIFNLQGMQVFRGRLPSTTNALNISLTEWPKGIYMATVQLKSGITTHQKLTVVH